MTDDFDLELAKASTVNTRRLDVYSRGGRKRMTPKMRRRLIHKFNHASAHRRRVLKVASTILEA